MLPQGAAGGGGNGVPTNKKFGAPAPKDIETYIYITQMINTRMYVYTYTCICVYLYIYIYGHPPPRSTLKGLAAKTLSYKHIISLHGNAKTP